MSSHHIVREKQEPALLVLGLNGFDADWLGQLLEWSPTLIANTLTALQLMAGGIYVDGLLTNQPYNPTTQANLRLIYTEPGLQLQSGLSYLINQGYPAVNIVTDEFMLADYLPFFNHVNLVIFYQQQKIYAVKSGFQKWKPAGSLIQMLNPPEDLIYENLLPAGSKTFEAIADGFITINFNNDDLIIAEKI